MTSELGDAGLEIAGTHRGCVWWAEMDWLWDGVVLWLVAVLGKDGMIGLEVPILVYEG